MLSMASLTSPSLSMSSLDMEIEPQFVNLDPKYTCIKCHKWLRRPYQTPCGHRICQSCLDDLFSNESEHGRGIPCPANEEGCEEIARDKVYPDYSALREVKQLKVFCSYRSFGCKETPSLGKLKDHIEKCKCIQTCPHCKERIPPDQIDNHIKDICQECLIPCQYSCGTADLPRRKMTEHYQDCPQKPRHCKYYPMGCQVQLAQVELVKHEADDGRHLELLTEHVSKLELENTKLQGRAESLMAELSSVKQQVAHCLQDNDELKRKLVILQENQRQYEEQHSQLVTTNSGKLVQVETLVRGLENKTQELPQLRAKSSEFETRIVELEQNRVQAEYGLPEDVRKKFISHDRTIGQHDVRLSELDLRLQCTETANYEGVLIWKIGEYRERKRQAVDGRILSLYSQPFYTSRYGYKMCARVYLNGDGVGRGSHMSLFFVVMQGDYDDILAWPFRQKVTMTLLDQRNNRRHLSDTFRPDPTSSSFQKPTTPMNVASGCPLFVQHTVLEDEREGLYLCNNTLFIKVVVDTSDLMNP